MEFRIADTFTDSLARLTGDEQKLVKTTAFDLQLNPAQPGMDLHRIDGARDKSFWSVRAGRDIRLVVHRANDSFLLCYVDHHDPAYRWAERRRLETHPKTGAAQLVEIRETVREVAVRPQVEASSVRRPALLARASDAELLGYGVPAEWMEDVRRADEESVLELVGHLPSEAAEAVLNLAVGITPQPAAAPARAAPFEHPDAQRRFRLMRDVEELSEALDSPWDKWTIFLHPAQRQWVEGDYYGPARVSGSAGTGKTVVALHRAVYLARNNPDARMLLATFSDILAGRLQAQLRRLIGKEPRLGERIEVYSLDALARRLYRLNFGEPRLASSDAIREALTQAASELDDQKFSVRFLLTEWEHVVDAWGLRTWEEYRDIARLGRKTRLPEQQRRLLWSIFERVRPDLAAQGLITHAGMFQALVANLAVRRHQPFDFAVLDEAQDIDRMRSRSSSVRGPSSAAPGQRPGERPCHSSSSTTGSNRLPATSR